ncbi:MAG: flagellar biosynthesis regulator FlaF [Rhodobacteraceae bacterium]|nr:flagellar biosynthesis regulator FlaF [Paracoccaceae bacterium]
MNVHTNALRGYSQSFAPTRTPRATEYSVIAQITHRMRSAAVRGKIGFPALAEALHDNRRLWTTLAVDVADSANALPPDLRARIVYLAEFTHVHTGKVLNGQATVKPLLEINAAILRGLNSESPAI